MLNAKALMYRRLLVVVVAVLLVAAQFSLLRHEVQLEKHKADHCAWCLTHAHLGDASPAAAFAPFAPEPPAALPLLAAFFILSFAGAPYQGRAPPR
jgi:hypothetical protein